MKGSMEQYGSKVSSNSTPKLFFFTSASLFQLWHVRNKPTVQCFFFSNTILHCWSAEQFRVCWNFKGGSYIAHWGGFLLGFFFWSFCWILFAWTRSFSSSGWRWADGRLKERRRLPGINSVWSFSGSYRCTTSAPWLKSKVTGVCVDWEWGGTSTMSPQTALTQHSQVSTYQSDQLEHEGLRTKYKDYQLDIVTRSTCCCCCCCTPHPHPLWVGGRGTWWRNWTEGWLAQ